MTFVGPNFSTCGIEKGAKVPLDRDSDPLLSGLLPLWINQDSENNLRVAGFFFARGPLCSGSLGLLLGSQYPPNQTSWWKIVIAR